MLVLTLLAAALPAAGAAAPARPESGQVIAGSPSAQAAEPAPATDEAENAATVDNPYGGHSDAELTALAAHWDSLDRHQRRALLTEMKLRMARNGERKNAIQIRTERRYGRIIRQSDGRVIHDIHIETQVLHVRPLDADALQDRQSFGVGFEQRIGRRQHELDARTAQPADAGADTAAASAGAGEAADDSQPSLNGVLDSLAPSTQAPQVNRLPVYQVSDPKR